MGRSPVAAAQRSRIERYLGRLHGYAHSLCGDADEARDLVQNCALKALTARAEPPDEAAYRAWLFRILRNGFLDQVRRNRVREQLAPKLADVTVPGEYWAAADRLISVLTVKRELARLPEAHREIIGLIDIAGLSYAEAAEALDVPAGTVMSRIGRARAALIAAIGDGNLRVLPDGEKRASE